jgi:transposase-like protein
MVDRKFFKASSAQIRSCRNESGFYKPYNLNKNIYVLAAVIMKYKSLQKRKCPHCGGSEAVLRGFRHNKNVRKQLMLCRGCGRKFTPDDGYLRMRFPPEVIKEAVSLYGKGFSSSDVSKRMARKAGIKVSRWTVLCWVRKYGKHTGME